MLLKTLLISASLSMSVALGQPHLPSWAPPTEALRQDPDETITDFSLFLPDKQRVTLQWRLAGALPSYFAVERSQDGKTFEAVSVMNGLKAQNLYQWTDEDPGNGRVLYRIRYAYPEGEALYSKTIMASIAGRASYKFYPNPVDHLLIVRAEQPLDIQIMDQQGKLRLSEYQVSGLRTLDLAGLEKGVYLIRFSNKLINVTFQEKLIKN